MHSQHKDWQIAQSRDCFCDFGRKLVNLRLPAYFTVMFCHGWQNKAASSHGGLVVAVHVTLPQSNPGRLRFSYFRTTEQNRHGFVQFVNQKSCMHYLTPTSSYKYKNAKACKKSIAFAFFSYSETESKTYGVVNEYTVQNENKRCKK